MKKIKIILFLIISIVIIEVVVNLYLFINKDKIAKHFLTDYKISHLFYIFPHMLYLHKIEILSPVVKLSSNGLFLNFEISEIIKKNFVIEKLYSKNIFLEIMQIKHTDVSKDEKHKLQKEINQFLTNLPSKIKIYEVKVKYKNKVVAIRNVTRNDKKRDKINIFFETGEEKAISKFNFSADLNKATWLLNGKIFLQVMPVKNFYHINLQIHGMYDFEQLQKYNLELINQNGEKKMKIYGSFKLLPIEFYSKIENNIINGELKIYENKKEDYISYNGTFNFMKHDMLRTYLTAKIGTDKEYELLINLSNNNFMFNSQVINNSGKFLVKYKNKFVNGIIKYYDTNNVLILTSNQKNVPFDFHIDFTEKNNVVLQGVVFDYKTETFITLNKQNFIVKSSAKSESGNIKFEFDTNYSTAIIYTKYDNSVSGSYIELNSFINLFKNIIFDIKSKNMKFVQKKFDFIAYGETLIKKDSINYKIDIKNLSIDKTQVLNNAQIIGEYKNNLCDFIVKGKDEPFYIKGNYNTKKHSYIAEVNIKRKNFVIGGIKTNLVSTLKIIKDEESLISGEWELENIYWNKQKVIDKINGKIKNDKDIIVLSGLAVNKGEKYPFITTIPLKTKIVNIKVQDIISYKFLEDKMTAEVNFDLNSIIKEKTEKYFTGKLYSSNSEIIISSSTYIRDKNIITLVGRIKNLNIKNNNFVGNFFCSIVGLQKNILEINIFFKNFWINNYYVENFETKCIYDIAKKQIEFVNSKNLTGKIAFLGNSVLFDNFNFFLSENKILFCNGKIGNNGNVLKLYLTKFPIETLINMFKISLADIKGEVDANIEIMTTMNNKILSYEFKSDLVAKDIEISKIKIEQINAEILSSKNYLTIKYFDVIFKSQQKISSKGSYNFDTKEMDFFVSSYRCDLSIFNNIYDVVKTAEGKLSLNAHIKGKKNKPQIYGFLTISNGKISFSKYGKYLKNINLELVFNKNKIDIKKCIAEYEQTKILAYGNYEINNKYFINVKTQNGDGLYVSIPELSLPINRFLGFVKTEQTFISNGNLQFDIIIKKDKINSLPVILGNIVMNNTYFTYPGKISVKKTGMFKKIFYDINLIANNNVWFENESLLANIVGKVNFKYSNGMDKSDINGEVDAVHGKVNFLNTYFNIKSGNLGIIHREVYLEVLAETDIVTQERERINVQLVIPRSKIEDIKPKLYSTTYPQLKTEDITALIIGVGKIQKYENKVEILSSEKIDVLPLLRTQFMKLVDTSLTTPFIRNILQKWGIADNVVISQVEPDFLSQNVDTKQNNQENMRFVDIFKNTKYGIEKYITPDMIIGYSISVAELQNKLSLRHEFEVSYRLKNNIFIKGVYDYGLKDFATGRYSSDVKIQLEPRFKLKSWAEEEAESEKEK